MSAQEKVLIVEDEENERTGLAELVTAWGYRTETARDGLEGLEKAAAWSPGIVLTDFKMPRMDGIELLQRLAEQAQPIATGQPIPDSWLPLDLRVEHAVGGVIDVLAWWLRQADRPPVTRGAEILDRLVIAPTLAVE